MSYRKFLHRKNCHSAMDSGKQERTFGTIADFPLLFFYAATGKFFSIFLLFLFPCNLFQKNAVTKHLGFAETQFYRPISKHFADGCFQCSFS